MATFRQIVDPLGTGINRDNESSNPSLGDRIRRFLPFFLGIFGAQQLKKAQDESKEATKAREDEIRTLFDEQLSFLSEAEQDALSRLGINRDEVLGAFDDLIQSTQSDFNSLIDEQAQGFGLRNEQVLGGFGDARTETLGTLQDRLDRMLASIEGVGEQERTDINQRSDERQAALRGELQSRGLGTSSLLLQSDATAERERGRELGNLSERIQRQRLGIIGEATGRIAGAQERFGFGTANLTAGLTGDALASNERLNQARISFDTALSGDRISALDRFGQQNRQIGSTFDQAEIDRQNAFMSFIERITDQFPDNNFLMDFARQFGQAQAGAPEQPSTFDTFAPPLIQAGGTVAAAKIFVGCIDADAMIATPNGDIPLREIQVGDLILNDRDEPKRVLFKDLGEPWDERKGHYVEVRSFGLDSLVLTRDHVIGGKPAIDWEDDKGIRVRPHVAVTSGDLLLEDGSNYLANGFVVHSMLTAEDVPDEMVASASGGGV